MCKNNCTHKFRTEVFPHPPFQKWVKRGQWVALAAKEGGRDIERGGGGPKVIALGRRGGGRGEKGRFLRCLLFGRTDRPKCRRQASIDGSLGMGLPRYFFSLSFYFSFLVHYRNINYSFQVFFSGGNGNTDMLFVSSQSWVGKFANCFLGSNFSPNVEKRNYNINKMSQSFEMSIIFLFSLVGFGLGDVRESFLPPPPSLSLSKHSCLSDGTRKWVFGPVFFGGVGEGRQWGSLSLLFWLLWPFAIQSRKSEKYILSGILGLCSKKCTHSVASRVKTLSKS